MINNLEKLGKCPCRYNGSGWTRQAFKKYMGKMPIITAKSEDYRQVVSALKRNDEKLKAMNKQRLI